MHAEQAEPLVTSLHKAYIYMHAVLGLLVNNSLKDVEGSSDCQVLSGDTEDNFGKLGQDR
jgi:hypothetical protein